MDWFRIFGCYEVTPFLSKQLASDVTLAIPWSSWRQLSPEIIVPVARPALPLASSLVAECFVLSALPHTFMSCLVEFAEYLVAYHYLSKSKQRKIQEAPKTNQEIHMWQFIWIWANYQVLISDIWPIIDSINKQFRRGIVLLSDI